MRPRTAWLAGVIGTGLLLGAGVAAAHRQAVQQPRGTLAFVRYTEQSARPLIYTRPLDGRPRRLRLPVAAAEGPAWSPGGSRLAFIGGRTLDRSTHVTADDDLYVIDADGSDVRRLTRDARHEAGPMWSPDGKYLVFVRFGETSNRSSLWVVGADGRGLRRLTYGSTDLQPSWAPGRHGIAFLRIDPKTRQTGIWLVQPDGSRLRPILAGRQVTGPVWSPNGVRLLVQDGKALYAVEPDGSRQRRLATLTPDRRGAIIDPQAAWSPDGRYVVFTQLRPTRTGRADLWIVAADGTGLRRLGSSPGLDTDPSWGP